MTIELTQYRHFDPGRQEDFFFAGPFVNCCCGRFKMVYSAIADTPIGQAHQNHFETVQ